MRFSDGSFRYCRRLTAQAGSNFSSSFLLLPPVRRRGMEVVYAFCRAMDDVVDRPDALPEEAQRELDRWRRELDACEQGFPTHPIAVAVEEIRREFSIPMEFFRKLITGVEMDLQRRRYGTFDELRRYCEHVASVVGLISVRVFGCRHPEADRYATELGIALQLTNILRDLKSDAEQGRIYLPAEDLRRFGVSESDLRQWSQGGRDPFILSLSKDERTRFQTLMDFQFQRAWDHFHKAREAFRSSGEGRKLLPAQIMGGVYARLLRRIQQSGYDVFSQKIRVSRPEQLWIAAKCLTPIRSP